MKILIVGGDKRNLFMAKNLKDKNIDVTGFNMIKGIKNMKFEDIDVSLYDIIIFPIDGVHSDYTVTAKYNEDELIIPTDFLKKTKDNVYIYSGINSIVLEKMCEDRNYIKLLDYEDVKWENGILTAEGIIANVINNTDISVKDSNVIIFGCGRVGKPLIKALKGLGANVNVGVKDTTDYITTENSFYTNQPMKEYLNEADIIINTVPELILDKKNLGYVNTNSYIIDVSSYPHGIDFDSAKELGLNIKRLPGIPGAVSPKSAAKILSKKIINLMKEN